MDWQREGVCVKVGAPSFEGSGRVFLQGAEGPHEREKRGVARGNRELFDLWPMRDKIYGPVQC